MKGRLCAKLGSPAAWEISLRADLECVQPGTARNMKNTPGDLYSGKFVFSCEQSTMYPIFKKSSFFSFVDHGNSTPRPAHGLASVFTDDAENFITSFAFRGDLVSS